MEKGKSFKYHLGYPNVPTCKQKEKYGNSIMLKEIGNNFISKSDIILAFDEISDYIVDLVWQDPQTALLQMSNNFSTTKRYEILEKGFINVKNTNILVSDVDYVKLNRLFVKLYYNDVTLNKGTLIDPKEVFTVERLQQFENIIAKDICGHVNPPIQIDMFYVKKNIDVFVIRDDLLIGGTKQRGLLPFLLLPEFDNTNKFVYAGPIYGYAQLALSFCSKLLGKQAVIFVAEQRNKKLHILTKKAMQHGALVHRVYPNTSLAAVGFASKQYINSLNVSVDEIQNMPFGLDCTQFEMILKMQLERALPRDLLIKNPKRMWSVIGSGLLLKVFYKVLPNTHFLVVRVGKSISTEIREMFNPEKEEAGNATFYNSPLSFWEDAETLPPYPSVPNYDAKLWDLVLKYGENGDYIWNVAGYTTKSTCNPNIHQKRKVRKVRKVRKQKMCHFYPKGLCKKGMNCPFLHI